MCECETQNKRRTRQIGLWVSTQEMPRARRQQIVHSHFFAWRMRRRIWVIFVCCYANKPEKMCLSKNVLKKNVIHCTHWPFRGILKGRYIGITLAAKPFSKEISVSMCTRESIKCGTTPCDSVTRHRARVIKVAAFTMLIERNESRGRKNAFIKANSIAENCPMCLSNKSPYFMQF